MPSDPASLALDFSRRAELSEWMDEPCRYEEFRACLHDLAQVNRMTFAYRPTRIWMTRLVDHLGRSGAAGSGASLHIVDVGSGQGDMLRMLGRWARRRGLRVRLTGLDLNPYAARAAREQAAGGEDIHWVTSDAFSYAPSDGVDVVLSSLFTHHLPDAGIVRYLAWMQQTARYGWFINDLHRGALPYQAFRLLARVARWHRFVQHDGPVSIRRSFSRADWRRYLEEAGIDQAAVQVETFRPARLCVGMIRR